METVLAVLDMILGATVEVQESAADAVGQFLANAIPGDMVEDDIARFLRMVADGLESGSSS